MKIVLVFLLLLTSGCGNKESVPPTNDNNVENKEEVVEKKLQIMDVNSKTRPIAVMVNNHKSAQPYQTGLNDAYLVYEMVVEGGITRMLAVFKDKNTQIGTVRSSRPYYLDYVLENDAIYVHFGWSDQAKEKIENLKINNINGLYDSPFWRDNSLNVATEHTVYTNIDKINSTIDNKGYSKTSDKETLLNYSIDEIDVSNMEGAIKAENVKIKFSDYQTNNFVYDSVNKVYSKVSNGEKRVDYLTKKDITAKNIITYQVEVYNISDYGHKEIKNIGKGDGYYITNGYAIPITWEKTSENSQTVYKYKDGTEIKVNDGNTHIQIQPAGQKIEFLEK